MLSICLLLQHIVLRSAGAESQPSLKIAIWDVGQAEKSIFSRPKTTSRPSWRHTFGSERGDRKKSRIGVFNLEADIVLLQGVRTVRALKRVFPARHWRLILSRDLIRFAPSLSRLPADLQAYDISTDDRISRHPVTAIAIRYQRRLRVRGIQHIPVANENAANAGPIAETPSGTAVRISYFGRSAWFVSLARPDDCRNLTTCNVWQAALAWRRELPATTSNVVAGISPVQDEIAAVSDQPESRREGCGSLMNLPLRGQSPQTDLATEAPRRRKSLGCIAFATFDAWNTHAQPKRSP